MAAPTCLPSTSHTTNNGDLNISKNSAVFDQISYLGSSKIENPLSENEMLQIVGNFNQEKAHDAINVIIIIPNFGNYCFGHFWLYCNLRFQPVELSDCMSKQADLR